MKLGVIKNNKYQLTCILAIIATTTIFRFTGNEELMRGSKSCVEPKMKIALSPQGNEFVLGLSFSQDGRFLAGSLSHETLILDVSSGRVIHKFPDFISGQFLPRREFIAIFPRWDFVAMGQTKQGLQLYRVGNWQKPEIVVDFSQGGTAWEVRGFSPDGKFIAIVHGTRRFDESERWVGIYEVFTWRKVSEFALVKTYGIDAVAFSYDGRFLATSADDKDGYPKIRIWEVQTGELISELKPSITIPLLNLSLGDHVYQLSFSPDGKFLASGHLNSVRLWDINTSHEVEKFKFSQLSDGMRDVSFSPNGRLLAALGEREFFIWDVKEREEVCRMQGIFGPHPNLDFSPDGNLLAISESEKHQERFLTDRGEYAYRDEFKRYIAIYEMDKLIGHRSLLPDGSKNSIGIR